MLLSRKALVIIITLLVVLHFIPYISGIDNQSIYSNDCPMAEYGYIFNTRNLSTSAFESDSNPVGKERVDIIWISIEDYGFFKDSELLSFYSTNTADAIILIVSNSFENGIYYDSFLASLQTTKDHIAEYELPFSN